MNSARIRAAGCPAMLGIGDKVRIRNGSPEVWTIAKILGSKFWIELDGEAATGQWKEESELELVEKCKDPDSGSGFTPRDPLF
jgi:hypothetical protein